MGTLYRAGREIPAVIHGEEMNEPLPVADELAIEKVQTLIFDSGL